MLSVECSGSRAHGLGSRVPARLTPRHSPCVRFIVQGSGFRVQGSVFSVQCSGFRVQCEVCRVSGMDEDCTLKVEGLVFRV